MSRDTISHQAPPIAECQGCQWTDTVAGALGRAAQHHDRTGHVVRVEVTRVITYGDEDLARRASGQTSMLEETNARQA